MSTTGEDAALQCSTEAKSPTGLQVETDEDERYDEILEELLSDDIDPTPKVELLDLEMEPSPTFQRFWATANDDEDYLPQEDINNLSKLIETLDTKDENENTVAPMMQYFISDENAVNPSLLSPVRKDDFVKSASESGAEPRTPFGVLDPHMQNSPGLRRRQSTGCIPEPKPDWYPNKALKIDELETQDGNTNHTDDDDEHVELDLQDILDLQLTLTASTVSSQSISEGNKDGLRGSRSEDTLEIQRLATSSSENSCYPSESSSGERVTKSTSLENQDWEITINHSKSTTSEVSHSAEEKTEDITEETDKADDISCTSKKSTKSQASRDPYEWAYNVWKRKGLMAGTPTGQKRPENVSAFQNIETVASTESSSSKISTKSKGSVKSKNSAKSKGSDSRPAVRITVRKPQDRQSLPAKISQHPQYQPKPKARNGAGFSILLSKWQDKSESNPNAHFLSPRELSPVRSRPQINTSNLTEPESKEKCASSNATSSNTVEAVPVSATIDTTPILSPSKRREKMRMEREEATNLMPPKNIFADNKGTANANSTNIVAQAAAALESSPAFSPRNTQKVQNAPEVKPSQPKKKVSSDSLGKFPTPAKNKNALARFLQKTKPTPTKPVPAVQSHAEKSKEDFAIKKATSKNQDKIHPTLDITPISTRRSADRRSVDGSRRRSVSPTSTVPSFLSPGDDTLLEPKDVMRHRRQRSDYTTGSKNSTRTPVHSVPCQEIFVMKDDQESIGFRSDDMRSMAGESVYSSVEKMHFTNLHDILETRADSMSFDSQSEVTHITFRTETLQNLDNKVSAMTNLSSLDICQEGDEEANETPTNRPQGEAIGVTPEYSERPWRKDLFARNVTNAMDKASGCKFECDCDYSLAMFSEQDEMVDFFLPLMAVTCSCRKSKKLVNPDDPISLENILRPWQIKFLKAFGIVQGDQLVKAHHRSAKSLAKSLYNWREKNSMSLFRVGSCGMALQIWSNTCKAYVRSIRKQMAQGADPIERPNTLHVLSTFLDKMPSQMHHKLPTKPPTREKTVDSSELEEI